MGFFDRLLGRDKFHRSGWSSIMESRWAATTTTFLQEVGVALALPDAEVLALNDQKQELRGTLLGYTLHVSILNIGSIGDISFRYAAIQGPYIDLEYDPDMKVDPTNVKPFDPSDRRIVLGPQVFVEGSSADEEAATFKKLPQELQERVIRDMRRLRIRYFRSRREEFDITMHDDPREGVSDPVQWLADTLRLAADVTKARGALPVGQGPLHSSAERKPPPTKDVEAIARGLANEIAKQVIGAKVVEREDDDCIDVRWTEGGVPVRIAIDHDFDHLEIEALARGAKGGFSLIFDPEITREAKTGGAIDPWDEDRFEFFGRSVFVNGKEAQVRAEASVLNALNPSLLGELVCLAEKRHATIDLDEEKLDVCLCEATQVTDRGAEAISVARLLARVASALPR
jgi:hypothetical protein